MYVQSENDQMYRDPSIFVRLGPAPRFPMDIFSSLKIAIWRWRFDRPAAHALHAFKPLLRVYVLENIFLKRCTNVEINRATEYNAPV